MAFMEDWCFEFIYKDSDTGELLRSPSQVPLLKLASIDDLFKSDLQKDETYYVAKEGVYFYSWMNKVYYKSK